MEMRGMIDVRSAVCATVLLMLGANARALAAGDGTVVVQMNALNGSGESGLATLVPHGARTTITIKLAGGSDIEQPAHFHTGTCDRYTPRPLYPLNDVVDGKSTTTIDVPIAKLTNGDLIINVHKSYADIATQAACAISKA
jgi:hypothetical protein